MREVSPRRVAVDRAGQKNPATLGLFRDGGALRLPLHTVIQDQEPTVMSARNKQVVEDFIQALFTRGELEAVDEYLAPDFVDHNPTIPGQTGDRESMRSAAELFRAAFPDWRSTVEDLIAADDKVVERFTARGTHESELMHIPPTGRVASLSGINIFRLRDGKIVERWGVLDQFGFMQQLGAPGAA
jgi:steroid delta-isomerase-like uncharacterized protein